jgi:hypothetical protein
VRRWDVKIRTVCRSAIVFLVVFSFAAVGEGVARVNTPPGIGVGLVIDGSATRIPGTLAFYEDDPLPLVLTLENRSGGDLITSQGFGGRPFHLFLSFTDPAGKGILADERDSASPTAVHVPPPKVLPEGLELKQVEGVEVLEGGASPWSLVIGIPDAHTFYTLFGNVAFPAGYYSVQAVIPMRTYSQVDYTVDLALYSLLTSVAFEEAVSSDPVTFAIIADWDCDGYFFPEGCADCTKPPACPGGWAVHPGADCDDQNEYVNPGAAEVPTNGIDDDCNPGTADTAPEPRGTIALHAVAYRVGQGSYPSVLPEPLAGMPVKIMEMSPGSCVAQQGLRWPKYDAIWQSCPAAGSGVTDGSGDLWITMPPGEYAILGVKDPNPSVPADEVYVSGTAVVAADTTQHVSVQAFVTPAGKFVPGLSTRRTGSELIVVEPEYIEWTGTQEYYPFVFRSVGEWNVTTSIAPPEGFVADAEALQADVNSALKAVQFVVTDIGSEWKDTKVKHKIKHRGRTKTVKSKIGVKNKKEKDKKK